MAVGLGKTHLIQAMGNEIANIYKGSVNVLYTSSEKIYKRRWFGLSGTRRMDDVKKGVSGCGCAYCRRYPIYCREADDRTRNFYTFNTLHENNKQIVISSDRPPSAIPALEERPVLALKGGMIVDVSYPDYEMRTGTSKTKFSKTGIFVDEKVLEQSCPGSKKHPGVGGGFSIRLFL